MIVENSLKDTRYSFNKWYSLALDYYNENGNLLVPNNYVTENGEKLGNWIRYMRFVYSSQKLKIPLEMVTKLQNIGMVWEKYDYDWQEKFEKIKAYYEQYHSLDIPSDYNNGEGDALVNWLKNQRKNYYSRERSPKMLEKILKLESIGLICRHKAEKWETMYAYACSYYEKYHNLLVPIYYETEDKRKLGIWIRNQRKAYLAGTLLEKRIKRLEDIGMVWNFSENHWNTMYEEAFIYYGEYHTLRLPKDFQSAKTTKIELAHWINGQRRLYKNNKLSLEQRTKLEMIGIERDYDEEHWQLMYNLACQYFLKNGHLIIKRDYEVEGENLGIWICTQRYRYLNRKLNPEKIMALEKIQMIWTPRQSLRDINAYLADNWPMVDRTLNKEILSHLSLKELKAKIKYLVSEKQTSIVDEEGYLKEIFTMSSIGMKNNPEYGLSLEEMINIYGKEDDLTRLTLK